MKIRVKLAKDPAECAVNNPNRKIGMLLGAKAGNVVWYFKIDDKKKGGISIDPEETAFSNTKTYSWLLSKMHLKFWAMAMLKNTIRELCSNTETKDR
jgi:hypothetical protein